MVNGKKWKTGKEPGFAAKKALYNDGENPFTDGSIRKAKATKKKNFSEISYQPNIPDAGKYAVYVSYQTLPKSVKDAKYLVLISKRRNHLSLQESLLIHKRQVSSRQLILILYLRNS